MAQDRIAALEQEKLALTSDFEKERTAFNDKYELLLEKRGMSKKKSPRGAIQGSDEMMH